MEDKKDQLQKYEYLDERLSAYSRMDFYPFHMPGHKRADLDFDNPYKIDITEIEGFDHLHHAQELLLQSQERLRKLYRSKKAYYLVNGSTCGILSAVGAVTKRGDSIIMARNCHKAVYNAVKLFGLKAAYVYPEIMECGIPGAIDADDVETLLKESHPVKAVIITSPTYDGIVSDIEKIADIIHRYHAYLIIDEAHGAHFSLNRHFPESAVRKGADIVIQSLHKTLPSFTQTAVLHIASDRPDCCKVEEMLRIFQTSSPSYILMAGMDRCIRMMEQSGKQLFEAYYDRLRAFYGKCGQLSYLQVLTKQDYEKFSIYDMDLSKIVICTSHTPINGQELYERLLHQYHLTLEMYSAQYVLAMTSVMDRQDGFDRLFYALKEIDQEFCRMIGTKVREDGCMNPAADEIPKRDQCRERDHGITGTFLEKVYAVREKVMEMSEMDDDAAEETALKNSIGRVCAEYIYLYPPGIPFIVPGELFTEELADILDTCRKLKLNVQGTRDLEYRRIRTVKRGDAQVLHDS